MLKLLCLAIAVATAAADSRILWAGNVTATSATVAAELLAGESASSIVISTEPNLSLVVFTAPVSAPAQVTKVTATGLTPSTRYYYGIPNRSNIGTFKTFKAGAMSQTVVFASCAFQFSDKSVFDHMRAENADLFIHMGDLHYEDINDLGADRHYQAYQHVFEQSRQRNLFQSLPMTYMWDDHDYAFNNADGEAAGRNSSLLTYHAVVPHYTLANNGTYGPIYQAFTVGRVRYILTDLRSYSDVETFMGEPSTLGAVQRAWLLAELANFASYSVVVWMSTKEWQGRPDPTTDKWYGYPKERAFIANYIAANHVNNLVMIAGDAHILGADDGSFNDYSDGGGAGFPIFQSAPMDAYGSDKGTGPYNLGHTGYAWWVTNHYSTMVITDDGVAPPTIRLRGMDDTDEKFRVVFDTVLTMPFVKNGTSSMHAGVSPVAPLPKVPSFVYVSVALAILSLIVGVGMTGIWWLWHWRYEARVYAVHGAKRTTRRPTLVSGRDHRHSIDNGQPDDSSLITTPQVPGRSSTVSINPMMVAATTPSKQKILVVEPLPGDPLAPPQTSY